MTKLFGVPIDQLVAVMVGIFLLGLIVLVSHGPPQPGGVPPGRPQHPPPAYADHPHRAWA